MYKRNDTVLYIFICNCNGSACCWCAIEMSALRVCLTAQRIVCIYCVIFFSRWSRFIDEKAAYVFIKKLYFLASEHRTAASSASAAASIQPKRQQRVKETVDDLYVALCVCVYAIH